MHHIAIQHTENRPIEMSIWPNILKTTHRNCLALGLGAILLYLDTGNKSRTFPIHTLAGLTRKCMFRARIHAHRQGMTPTLSGCHCLILDNTPMTAFKPKRIATKWWRYTSYVGVFNEDIQ